MAVTKYVTEATIYGRKGVLWLMDPGDRSVRHMVMWHQQSGSRD